MFIKVGFWRLAETIRPMFSATTTPGKKLITAACSGSSAQVLFQRRMKYATSSPTARMETTSAARQLL